MAYGYRSRTRKVSPGSYRRRRYTSGAIGKRVSRVPRRTRSVAKFATVAYRRDVEMKYADKSLVAGGGVMLPSDDLLGGWSGTSGTAWNRTNFGGTSTNVSVSVQDLLKGVPQGITAQSRVGNKINVKSLKVKITMTANYVDNATTGFENAQNGESVIDNTNLTLRQYMRTTTRIIVVRDTQVNSTSDTISYNEVMESQSASGFSGVHSELSVERMGRFKVMSDKMYKLDADDPMKTVSYNFYNIGPVRYTGPETVGGNPALNDVGIYVIWATYSQGKLQPLALNASPMGVSRRMCFTDS